MPSKGRADAHHPRRGQKPKPQKNGGPRDWRPEVRGAQVGCGAQVDALAAGYQQHSSGWRQAVWPDISASALKSTKLSLSLDLPLPR